MLQRIPFVLTLTFIGGTAASLLSPETKTGPPLDRLQRYAKEAQSYCKEKGLNNDYCILVDMQVHSGRHRLFVWDFSKDTIGDSGLCTHGTCDNLPEREASDDEPEFSNIPGSHCSSLGKYKIGKRAWSNWGINVHYKLHGLDATNNNAFKRIVVLHSWGAIPDEESWPDEIVLSWGCPAVSDNFMRRLDNRLQKTEKPVLLWIYN